MIPEYLQDNSIRFCKLAGKTKIPAEDEWQTTKNYTWDNKELQDWIQAGNNYGIVCGYGNLIIIDADTPEIIQLLSKLTPTFTIKSGKKGFHAYYRCRDQGTVRLMKGKVEIGKIISKGAQGVGAGSTHPETGRQYTIHVAKEIQTITKDDIVKVFKEYMVSERIDVKELILEGSIDGNRNNAIFKLAAHLRYYKIPLDVTQDFCEEVNKKSKPPLSIKELKACVQSAYQYEGEIPSDEGEPAMLDIVSFQQLLNFNDTRKYLIEEILPEASVSMVVSPPENFKTMMCMYMGVCLASGLDFAGKKTIKSPVLYCDLENGLIEAKTRIANIANGLGIEDKKLPIYYTETQLSLIGTNPKLAKMQIEALMLKITELGIKTVFLDTLHRFGRWDENSSNDVNELYTKLFIPLKRKGVSVVYLHHTNKKGDVRGSGDLLGNPDTIYACQSKQHAETSYTVFFTNEKMRCGVRGKKYSVDIVFEPNSILIETTDAKESKLEKKKLCKTFVINILSYNKCTTQQEILDLISKMPDGNQITPATLKKAMTELQDRYIIGKELGFYKLLPKASEC